MMCDVAYYAPKGGMCCACVDMHKDCSALPFSTMPVLNRSGSVITVKCTEHKRAPWAGLVEPPVEPILRYVKHEPVLLGGYYTRHVEAMTAEGLERKSEIAVQLAWRDQEIDRLKNVITALQADHRQDFNLFRVDRALLEAKNRTLLDAINVVAHEQHAATEGIVDLHIIAGKRAKGEL